MTSFLSLPFRINDMARGTMGRVSESYLVTTDEAGLVSTGVSRQTQPYLYNKRITLYQSIKEKKKKTPTILGLISWFLLQTAEPSQLHYFLYDTSSSSSSMERESGTGRLIFLTDE